MTTYFGSRQAYAAQRRRTLIVASLATVVPLVACITGVILISHGSENKEPHLETTSAPERLIEVLVPLRDISPYMPLSPELFQRKQISETQVPDGAVVSYEQIAHQYSRGLIVANHPLLQAYLSSSPPSTSVVRNQLQPGFRAVTIKVDKLSSVDGWTDPGTTVDVLWLTKERGEETLVPLVWNVRVLSVDQRTDPDRTHDAEPSTVTLEVQTADAHRIELAADTGKLSLSLRGNEDYRGEIQKGIQRKDLLRGILAEVPAEKILGTIKVDGITRKISLGEKGARID